MEDFPNPKTSQNNRDLIIIVPLFWRGGGSNQMEVDNSPG